MLAEWRSEAPAACNTAPWLLSLMNLLRSRKDLRTAFASKPDAAVEEGARKHLLRVSGAGHGIEPERRSR
jgi:hypothetical protein